MGTHSILPSGSQHDNSLEIAGKIVDGFIKFDNSAPQLMDLLRVSSSGPTVSGLQDIDYPVLQTAGKTVGTLSQHGIVKRVPLPGELVEQFGHLQYNCMMGLFPEIGRAWLTIDSDIFVWTYDDAGDLAYFNGLSETILSVALVKPKPGIFKNHIHYLLCLTTPIEIILLGVSFSITNEDDPVNYLKCEMHLLPEPLFLLPSDNNYFLTIVGTQNGRIFLGSKSGSLFEFIYQAEDGWFSRKCRKVNHSQNSLLFFVPSLFNFAFAEDDPIVQIAIDNSRNILYTRSEKGSLQVYDLGQKGNSTSKVTSYSQKTIVNDAYSAVRTIDRSNFKPIVHIAAINSEESMYLHLVAITQSGVRLYFTTTSFNHPTSRPFTLQLLHVRLPPGFAANAPPQCPSRIYKAHYRQGNLVLVSAYSDDNDSVWTISSDTFAFQQQLMETQNSFSLDGKVWALAEASFGKPYGRHSDGMQLAPPLVVTQHMELPRKFIFLTPQGCYISTQLRPVDLLHHLLNENQGPDGEAIKAFFTLHNEDLACATCLILACSVAPQNKQVSEWAARAFFLYGGEPIALISTGYTTVASPSPTFASSRFMPPQASTPKAAYFGGYNSFSSSGPNYLSAPNESFIGSQLLAPGQVPSVSGSDIRFSGKHNGLYMYLSRILRPVWDYPIVKRVNRVAHDGSMKEIVSSITAPELDFLQNHVAALKEFLDTFAQVKSTSASERLNRNVSDRTVSFLRTDIASSGDGQIQQQLQKRAQADAQLQEKSSLINLQLLMGRIWEILSLWKILDDHHIDVVIGSSAKDIQNQVQIMTFRDLVINGRELANNLVSALINRYLDDNATTDAISSRLRDVCPSIYKTEDAVSAKTIEMLLAARKIQNAFEKEKILQDALQLAKQIPLQLNIPVICSYFQAVHCYSAIVELCLTAAFQRDPQGIALQFYRNGERPEDQQGLQAYMERLECYTVILNALEQLTNISLSHPQSPSIPKLPGAPEAPDPNMLSPKEASQYCAKTFRLILKSDDELVHVTLYKWLLDKKLIDNLMEIRSVYLENYLKRSCTANPENLETLDFLWKFYEKSENYSAAARVLAKLAERHGNDVDLTKRMEYLSRALICIKSSEVRISLSSEGEFLQHLEEKLEVARIQMQVLDALLRVPRNQLTQDAIVRLNSDLLDITVLYKDFAEAFNLNECKLAIVHCANHYDPTLIEALWKSILEKEFVDVAGSSPDNIVACVGSKIKTLGSNYFSSQKYFPVAFVTKYLEQESARLGLNHRWVFAALNVVGFPKSHLLDIYSKLYKLKDPFWPTIRKPLHLLCVMCQLIDSYADSVATAPYTEKRRMIMTCLDYIASYMVDLQAMGTVDDIAVRELMNDFRAVQAKLERIS